MTDATHNFEASFKEGTKIHQVYLVLKDQAWHCRECEYSHVGITQIAGGSGIQGLQRGTGSRAGMVLESRTHNCAVCQRATRQDRWAGELKPAIPATAIPQNQIERFLRVLGRRDIVEMTNRQPSEITIDHKLPMIRWNPETTAGQTNYSEMTDDEIRDKFQILKASNGSVSHNLLKSRACEQCLSTGYRGTPFGITFFYQGDAHWEPEDPTDPTGCIGCGWYDFDRWRRVLNTRLNRSSHA